MPMFQTPVAGCQSFHFLDVPGKVVETSSDRFRTIVLAVDPSLPFWAAFIQSQLRNGHERVVKR